MVKKTLKIPSEAHIEVIRISRKLVEILMRQIKTNKQVPLYDSETNCKIHF